MTWKDYCLTGSDTIFSSIKNNSLCRDTWSQTIIGKTIIYIIVVAGIISLGWLIYRKYENTK